MRGRHAAAMAIVLLALAPDAVRAADAGGFDLAIRALSAGTPLALPAADDAGGDWHRDDGGWRVRAEATRVEHLFLLSTLQVVRSRLPLPSGLGMAVTAYDVLDGRVQPGEALANVVQGEAVEAVFAGVQAAMLWLAAKAMVGGTTVAGAGVSAAAVSTTAPAAGVAVAPLAAPVAGVKLGGVAFSGPLADLVAFGAVGVATLAAAAASTAIGWGWAHYQEAAWRAAEAEGLLRGAERVVAAGPPAPAPLPPR